MSAAMSQVEALREVLRRHLAAGERPPETWTLTASAYAALCRELALMQSFAAWTRAGQGPLILYGMRIVRQDDV